MQKKKSQKNSKPPVSNMPAPRTEVNDVQLELEIYWCVQKLEQALNSGKLSKKIHDDTLKNLRILKSSTAPLIRKRQVMNATFGDYRSKMKEEEKKMSLSVKQIKFTTGGKDMKKSSFVKKATVVSSENGSKLDNAREPTTNGSQNTVNEEGNGFKFNFVIEDVNDCLDVNKLSIVS